METEAAPVGEPPSIHLSELFAEATVQGELPEITDFAAIDWRFDRPFEPLPVKDEEEEEEPDSAETDKEPEADEEPEPDDRRRIDAEVI